MEQQYLKEARKDVMTEFSKAEKKPKPAWTEMFTDVYKEVPPHIRYNSISLICLVVIL